MRAGWSHRGTGQPRGGNSVAGSFTPGDSMTRSPGWLVLYTTGALFCLLSTVINIAQGEALWSSMLAVAAFANILNARDEWRMLVESQKR